MGVTFSRYRMLVWKHTVEGLARDIALAHAAQRQLNQQLGKRDSAQRDNSAGGTLAPWSVENDQSAKEFLGKKPESTGTENGVASQEHVDQPVDQPHLIF